MRAIKFRAWDKEKKVMRYEKLPLIESWWDNDNWDDAEELMEDPYYYFTLPWQDRLVWQQWTGLKDKNEKDIYEGDVVKTDNRFYNYGKWEDKFEVRWDRLHVGDWGDAVDCWVIENEPLSNFAEDCMLIGNIFETPELLNK